MNKIELDKRTLVGLDDFVLLDDFMNEDAFMENLKIRYQSDIIYVFNLFRF